MSRNRVSATNGRRKGDADAWDLLERSRKTGYRSEFVSELRALASGDNCSALNVLAMLYRQGLRDSRGKVVVKPSSRAALRYDERAAELGDPGAMTAIADRLSGPGVGRAKLRQAERLYQLAFRQGYETAAYNLARAYQNRGNYRAAVRWYRKAFAAGDASALLELGRAELYGVGTRRNVTAALAKLHRVARSKDIYWPSHWLQCEAMLVIADAHINGWLAVHDFAEGLRWLRRAAKHGNESAMLELASYNG